MTTAGIMGCVQVRVFPDDIPTMFVPGARPLQRFSARLLGDYSGYESARFARSLVDPVDGPFVAVGRTGAGPITVLDGLHDGGVGGPRRGRPRRPAGGRRRVDRPGTQ